MSFVIFMVIGLIALIAIWWISVPGEPAKKAVQMGLSFIAAGASAAVFIGVLFAVCSWMSVAIGHQPLHP